MKVLKGLVLTMLVSTATVFAAFEDEVMPIDEKATVFTGVPALGHGITDIANTNAFGSAVTKLNTYTRDGEDDAFVADLSKSVAGLKFGTLHDDFSNEDDTAVAAYSTLARAEVSYSVSTAANEIARVQDAFGGVIDSLNSSTSSASSASNVLDAIRTIEALQENLDRIVDGLRALHTNADMPVLEEVEDEEDTFGSHSLMTSGLSRQIPTTTGEITTEGSDEGADVQLEEDEG